MQDEAAYRETQNRRLAVGNLVAKRWRKKTPRALRTQDTNDALKEALEMQCSKASVQSRVDSGRRASGRRGVLRPARSGVRVGGSGASPRGAKKLTLQRTAKEDGQSQICAIFAVGVSSSSSRHPVAAVAAGWGL